MHMNTHIHMYKYAYMYTAQKYIDVSARYCVFNCCRKKICTMTDKIMYCSEVYRCICAILRTYVRVYMCTCACIFVYVYVCCACIFVCVYVC